MTRAQQQLLLGIGGWFLAIAAGIGVLVGVTADQVWANVVLAIIMAATVVGFVAFFAAEFVRSYRDRGLYTFTLRDGRQIDIRRARIESDAHGRARIKESGRTWYLDDEDTARLIAFGDRVAARREA